jgi:hypothetical protein
MLFNRIGNQMSLIAGAVQAFRAAVDMSSIDESERQQIILKEGEDSISLEELLDWVEDFATNQGPRLISSGSRFATQTATVLAQHRAGLLHVAARAPIVRASTNSSSSTAVADALRNLQESMLNLLRQLRQVART